MTKELGDPKESGIPRWGTKAGRGCVAADAATWFRGLAGYDRGRFPKRDPSNCVNGS